MAKSRPAKSAARPWLRRWIVQSSALLLAIAALIGGLIWLGRWGLEQIRGQDRYLVAVTDIECDPPYGMDRTEFLDQVRYDGRLPERLDLLDEELPARLREAFRKHAAVENVDAVTLKPPRQIIVRLAYRTPVLAVWWDGDLRAVDGHGVFLPKRAPTAGLPIYQGEPRPPQGKAGTRWGDPELERQARQLHERGK